MLQVAMQKTNAVKTDFSAKSKTQDLDCNEKFEDYLSSISADSDDSNATSKGKGVKFKKVCSSDDNQNDKSNENEPSKLTENFANSISNTSPSEEPNEVEKVAYTQTETSQSGEVEKSFVSQLMPIMPMPSTTVQQYVDEMGNIGTNSSLQTQQIASAISSMETVGASSSLDLQQLISINSKIDNINSSGLPDSPEISPDVDLLESPSTNEPTELYNVSQNLAGEVANDLPFVRDELNQTEISAPAIDATEEDFSTEDFIDVQQTDEASLKFQKNADNPLPSNIVTQSDASKNHLQSDEVATQFVVESSSSDSDFIKNNEPVKQTVVSQNVQMSTDVVNNPLKTRQTQIISGTDNKISKMGQTPIDAEKISFNEPEPNVKAVASKGLAQSGRSEVASDDSVKNAPTNSQLFASSRVFSGKENDITATVHQENIVKQVANSIVTMAKTGNQKFTMELTPETLGRITVEMKYTSGKLEMKINADNTVTTKVLGERIAELKSSLTANDVDVSNIDISYSSSAHSSFADLSKNSNQAGGQDSGTNKRQYHENEILYNDAGVSDENTNATIYYNQNQLLNYLV